MSLIERFMDKLEGGGSQRRPVKRPPVKDDDASGFHDGHDHVPERAIAHEETPDQPMEQTSGQPRGPSTIVVPDGFDDEPRPLFDVASFGFDGDGRAEDWVAVDYGGAEGAVKVEGADKPTPVAAPDSMEDGALEEAEAATDSDQAPAHDPNDIFGTPPELLSELDAIERGLPAEGASDLFDSVEDAANAATGESFRTTENAPGAGASDPEIKVQAGGELEGDVAGIGDDPPRRPVSGGPSSGGEEDSFRPAPEDDEDADESAAMAESEQDPVVAPHPAKRRRMRGRGPSAGGEEEIGSGGEDDDPLADIDPDELSPELRAELDEFISPPKAKVVKALATAGGGQGGPVGVTPQLILDEEDEDYEPDEASGFRAVNHVELNLDRLREMGMVTPDSARGKIAEEYRMIKRPLLQNILGDGERQFDNPNLIMVTSSVPGEGKTFTSVNLAMSLAMELDRTVLLVDADVAKPSFARLFDMETEAGLIDVLLEDVSMRDVLLTTNVPKLRLMPAGRRHPNSVELLASDGMRSLAQEMAQRYPDRIIVFDSPPLLVTSEAAVLASLMSQIVVVAEANKTPQFVLQDSLALLDRSKYIGLVLNKARPNARSGYYYDYRYPSYYGYYGYGQ